jgi:hypothetical protein
MGNTNLGATNVVATSGSWLGFNSPHATMPKNVTHYLLKFNMNAVGAGTYYFDDIVVTAM